MKLVIRMDWPLEDGSTLSRWFDDHQWRGSREECRDGMDKCRCDERLSVWLILAPDYLMPNTTLHVEPL